MDTDNDDGGEQAGVAIDPDGNLYIADPYNFRIRRVSPDSGRLSPNTPANPAKAGEVISLFATGLGRSGSPLSVTISGVIATVISADTQSAGVTQVRVGIPAGVQAGAEVAVRLQAGNSSSPAVTIAVK